MPRTPVPWEIRVRRYFTEGAPDECWPWTGSLHDGYGRVRLGGKGSPGTTAHRAVYELLVGPVAPGLHLDHECHNRDASCPGGACVHRSCVNPAHMRQATSAENTLAGRAPSAVNAGKDRCPRGHEYDVAYTTGGRTYRACRTCRNDRRRELRAAR